MSFEEEEYDVDEDWVEHVAEWEGWYDEEELPEEE